MLKHVRQAVERVRALGADATATRGNKHWKLTATVEGVSVEVPVSSTPADPHACVNMVVQMVRRRFAERDIDLSRAA